MAQISKSASMNFLKGIWTMAKIHKWKIDKIKNQKIPMMKKPRGNTMEGIIRGELGIIVLMLKGDSLENKFI